MPVSTSAALSVKQRFKNLGATNLYSIVNTARKGLKTSIFYEFAEAINMPEKKLAGIINLTSRTISNYKDQKKYFGPSYSEHLLKLIALFEKGEELFGNVDEFNYWLKKDFWNSDEKPENWLTTPGGVDLLMEELDKIAQGYPA